MKVEYRDLELGGQVGMDLGRDKADMACSQARSGRCALTLLADDRACGEMGRQAALGPTGTRNCRR